MTEEKQYYFCASFFDYEYGENVKKIYDTFKQCMRVLQVPVDVSLVFDETSPNGRIILTRKEEKINLGKTAGIQMSEQDSEND